MVQYSGDEKELWELSEKLLVQMIGSERAVKYRTNELVKHCNSVALEFLTSKHLSLDEKKETNNA